MIFSQNLCVVLHLTDLHNFQLGEGVFGALCPIYQVLGHC